VVNTVTVWQAVAAPSRLSGSKTDTIIRYLKIGSYYSISEEYRVRYERFKYVQYPLDNPIFIEYRVRYVQVLKDEHINR